MGTDSEVSMAFSGWNMTRVALIWSPRINMKERLVNPASLGLSRLRNVSSTPSPRHPHGHSEHCPAQIYALDRAAVDGPVVVRRNSSPPAAVGGDDDNDEGDAPIQPMLLLLLNVVPANEIDRRSKSCIIRGFKNR